MAHGDARMGRRLAAILAADVVGYSRLVGADEEATVARLRVGRRKFSCSGVTRLCVDSVLSP